MQKYILFTVLAILHLHSSVQAKTPQMKEMLGFSEFVCDHNYEMSAQQYAIVKSARLLPIQIRLDLFKDRYQKDVSALKIASKKTQVLKLAVAGAQKKLDASPAGKKDVNAIMQVAQLNQYYQAAKYMEMVYEQNVKTAKKYVDLYQDQYDKTAATFK